MAKLNKQAKTLILVGSVIVVLLVVLLIVLPLLPTTEEEQASLSSSSTMYTLLDADLTDIQSISVQNDNGGFTVKRINDENFDVPELKGFDILQENIDFFPDAVRVMKTDLMVNENPEDLSIFGLEKPAATVEYTMTDGSTFGLELGNQVTGETNYYVKVTGKPEVYVLTSSVAGYFFIPKEDFVSRTVLPEASEIYTDQSFDSKNMLFDKITVSGTHVPETVVVTQVTDTTGMSQAMIDSYKYNVTDGTKTSLLHTSVASQFYQSFFNVTATDVVKVLPTEEDLEEYGLKEPYCTVSLEAGGITTTLSCSAKDEDGYYYVMKKGYNVIYKVAADALFWAEYTYADMTTDLLFSPYIYDVKSIRIQADSGESYQFDSNTPEVSDDLVVLSNGKEVDKDEYRDFYELLIYTTKETELTGEEDLSAEPKMTITFVRKNGTEDVIRLIPISARSLAFELNGTAEYAIRVDYANKILKEADNLLNGRDVTSDW